MLCFWVFANDGNKTLEPIINRQHPIKTHGMMDTYCNIQASRITSVHFKCRYMRCRLAKCKSILNRISKQDFVIAKYVFVVNKGRHLCRHLHALGVEYSSIRLYITPRYHVR